MNITKLSNQNHLPNLKAKREHALAQTNLLADKTLELNDLRAQKAADDVSTCLIVYLVLLLIFLLPLIDEA
jgi:hypothetical protein